MPRYLLNVIDGSAQACPIEVEAPDLLSLRREALRTACLSINESHERFWGSCEWQMIVTDASGLMLLTLHFNATVAPAMSHVL